MAIPSLEVGMVQPSQHSPVRQRDLCHGDGPSYLELAENVSDMLLQWENLSTSGKNIPSPKDPIVP